VGGVELMFDGFHEGQGIAGSAPGVEGGKLGGTVEEDERTVHSFEVGAQTGEGLLELVGGAFETEPAEAGGIVQRFPVDMKRIGGALEEFDGAREVGGKRADFGDGRYCGIAERPKFLTGEPDSGRGFGNLRGMTEGAQLGGLRVEAGFGAFEENVGGERGVAGEMGLQSGVGELRILDGKDELLRLFGIGSGNGEGTRVVRERMKAEDGAGDDAERAESTGDEFGEVVTGDVFDDFAAARSEGAIGKGDGNADDEVAEGAETETERAAVVGGEDAARGDRARGAGRAGREFLAAFERCNRLRR